MNLVTDKHREDYRVRGFALVENVIPPQQLVAIKTDLNALWGKAKRKEVNPIRVYDDFPYFLGGVNVAAIEDPFYKAPVLKEWIAGSGMDEIIPELTGWSGADLELARIHMNDRYKYQGFWHRDATVKQSESSVVAIAYFEDEAGFRIVPSTGKFSDTALPLGDETQRRYSYETLEDEYTVAAPAGSVFFMKSYLLHRGYNNKLRLHLHMRFIKGAGYNIDAWSQYRNPTADSRDFSKSSSAKRTRTLISYLVPRSNRSSLFQP